MMQLLRTVATYHSNDEAIDTKDSRHDNRDDVTHDEPWIHDAHG
jgi:hypothetical protein